MTATRRTDKLLIGAYGTVLTLALAARLAWLDSLPGFNGDEAWYGLWVERLLRDGAWGWRTPTGNLANPFFLLPLAAIQALAAPAPWVVRAIAALSGLAFVGVGYACLRRTVDRRSAAMFAVLAATLPIAVIYGRFGWDASQTPLAAMIFVCCCLSGRIAWAVLALAASFIVHPSNVFLFPILAAFLAQRVRPDLVKLAGNAIARRLVPLVLVAGTLAAIPVSLAVRAVSPGDLASATYWLRAATLFGDLFSGVTVYRYVVGQAVGLGFHRAVVCAILVATLLRSAAARRDARHEAVDTLSAGLAAAIGAYLIIIGPLGLTPNTERYSQFLIAPVLVVVAATAGRLRGSGGAVVLWLAPICGGLALFSLWVSYFEPLRASGGVQPAGSLAERAFHTAAVEPKAQAAAWLIGHAGTRTGVRTTVLAAEWWLEKPLQYLLFYHPEFVVAEVAGGLPGVIAADTVAIAFADSKLDEELSRSGAEREQSIRDAAGIPFLNIYAVPRTD